MANHVYTNINITFESNDASNKYIQDVLQYDNLEQNGLVLMMLISMIMN